MAEEERSSAHWGWIVAIAALVIVALFLAMHMTNEQMQSDGQPPPEQLKERSGDLPGGANRTNP